MTNTSHPLRAAAAVLGAAFLTACMSSSPARSNTPLGSLTLVGPAFGAQALQPMACSTGEREYFLGFDLSDEKAGIVARLIVDPATGPVLRVFSSAAPFDKSIVFHRSECRVFHFSVDSTAWRVNDIQQLKVSLDVDCELPSGDSIVGKAQDRGCL